MTDKIKIKTTTVREFQSEDEYQAYITDLENSELFSFDCILAMRNRAEFFTQEIENGYFGEEISVRTHFTY